jgi:hypothetical protein
LVQATQAFGTAASSGWPPSCALLKLPMLPRIIGAPEGLAEAAVVALEPAAVVTEDPATVVGELDFELLLQAVTPTIAVTPKATMPKRTAPSFPLLGSSITKVPLHVD